MKVIGTIERVFPCLDKDGHQRSFEGKDGTPRKVWNVIVCRTYDNGDADKILCETIRDENSTTPFSEHVGTGTPLTLNIYFDIREYNGKYFQSIRLVNVMQQLS